MSSARRRELEAALERGYLVARMSARELRAAWHAHHDRCGSVDVVVTPRRSLAAVRLDLAQAPRGLSPALVDWIIRIAERDARDLIVTRRYVRLLVPLEAADRVASWLVELAREATKERRAA